VIAWTSVEMPCTCWGVRVGGCPARCREGLGIQIVKISMLAKRESACRQACHHAAPFTPSQLSILFIGIARWHAAPLHPAG
jgi:hypothetical protein